MSNVSDRPLGVQARTHNFFALKIYRVSALSGGGLLSRSGLPIKVSLPAASGGICGGTNVADGLFAIADALNRVADAIAGKGEKQA